ncbi:IclR family transcriptional regulator [Domibacillus epiphyticus]|uniref:IclR family transcriptional regulator n=1 Tax=Domibacillus epiphyticus TaxID=1714355 RepID=A0A1V2AAS6_9BACI|nr:IclR family transcriptional regulator [Domibacillus epiphyticus]OMP68103.1 IclR family transcriptional regulator [Domibacillus epiphyticus]
MNKTVLKSMEILRLFFNEEKLTLLQIMEKTELPKTSAYRMAESLLELGFLEKDKEGAYRLGLIFLTLGNLVAERLDVRTIALPYMKKLRKETGEAVNLVIRDGDEAVYIEKVDTQERVRVYTQIGRRAPLYGGACPRILLSFTEHEERERLIDSFKIVPYAKGTPNDKNDLRRLIEETREAGWSVSHSELENHSSAIAAPIFNHKGDVVAGISLVGPEVRFRDEVHVQAMIEKLTGAAFHISTKLGQPEDNLLENREVRT